MSRTPLLTLASWLPLQLAACSAPLDVPRAEPSSPPERGILQRSNRYVDEANRFELVAPNSSWRVGRGPLPGYRTMHLAHAVRSSTTAAGAQRTTAWGMVLLARAGGRTLEEYAEAIATELGSLTWQKKDCEHPLSGGRPALRYRVGLPERHEVLHVLTPDWIYTLIGSEGAEELFDGFRLLEGSVLTSSTAPYEYLDNDGGSWRIQEQRLTSVAHGVELRLPDKFLGIKGSNLVSSLESELALTDPLYAWTISFRSLYGGSVEQAERDTLKLAKEEGYIELGDRVPLLLGTRPVSFRLLGGREEPARTPRSLLAFIERASLPPLAIEIAYLPMLETESLGDAQRILSSVRLLESEEIAHLMPGFAPRGLQRQLNRSAAVRGRVARDFGAGLAFRAPPEFVDLWAGPPAATEHWGTSIVAHAPLLGVAVEASVLHHTSHARAHGSEVQALDGWVLRGEDSIPTQPNPTRVSLLSPSSRRGDSARAVFTRRVGRAALVVHVLGPAAHIHRGSPLLSELARGFESEPRPPRIVAHDYARDLRYGLEIQLDGTKAWFDRAATSTTNASHVLTFGGSDSYITIAPQTRASSLLRDPEGDLTDMLTRTSSRTCLHVGGEAERVRGPSTFKGMSGVSERRSSPTGVMECGSYWGGEAWFRVVTCARHVDGVNQLKSAVRWLDD